MTEATEDKLPDDDWRRPVPIARGVKDRLCELVIDLAPENKRLRERIDQTDRAIRAWRRSYFQCHLPNTYLANMLNDILRVLGTYEADPEKNAIREAKGAPAEGPSPFCPHPARCNAARRCTKEIVCND